MEKAKREANPFDICPKHKGFYKSCGCDWKKGKKSAKAEASDSRDSEEESEK